MIKPKYVNSNECHLLQSLSNLPSLSIGICHWNPASINSLMKTLLFTGMRGNKLFMSMSFSSVGHRASCIVVRGDSIQSWLLFSSLVGFDKSIHHNKNYQWYMESFASFLIKLMYAWLCILIHSSILQGLFSFGFVPLHYQVIRGTLIARYHWWNHAQL